MSSGCAHAVAFRARLRGLGVVLACAVVLAPLTESPALAQASTQAEIELVTQRIFHRPNDPLGLTFRVTNTGASTLDGFQISVALYDRVVSRSELHQTFDGVATVPVSSYTVEFARPLTPQESRIRSINDTLSERLVSLPSVEGVYPVTVSLAHRASGTALDSFTTELILYPTAVDVPLNLSLVVPIGGIPARGPGGAFVSDPAGGWPLEQALSGGWLEGLADALEQNVSRGLRVGLAPSPRFVEELQDMADGYRESTGEETTSVDEDAPAA